MPKKLPFEVIHVSGHDEGYSGKELEVHSPTTRGWQSLRFCEYPQEIIFSLKEQCKITKIQVLSHQHNIGSKIEFFIGESKEQSLRSCSFSRLGYVQLAPNAEANYQARELKSVTLNKDGIFVKILVHRNHINKLNVYNQVGLVAVNILGYQLSKEFEGQHPQEKTEDVVNYYMNQVTSEDEVVNTSKLNASPRYEYGKEISPYDDLAFDMYQDSETAQLIRKLDEKKHQAIIEERYDYAKKLKEAISDLHKVGQKLGKFEVEKRRAVELEDFDTAKKKKLQSDEYRVHVYKQLDIYDLLQIPKFEKDQVLQNITNVPKQPSTVQTLSPKIDSSITTNTKSEPEEVRLPPINTSSTINNINHYSHASTTTARSPRQQAEENMSSVEAMPEINVSATYDIDECLSQSQNKNDERPLPSLNNRKSQGVIEEQENENDTHNETELPLLNEKEEREAELIIDIFGMNVAQQLYSKSWKHRQTSLTSLADELKHSTEVTEEQPAKSVSRAVLAVLKKSLNDQVFVVLNESTTLLKTLLQNYIPEKSLGKAEVTFVLDKLLPILMKRLGDSATRTRNLASDVIIDIANSKEIKNCSSIPNIVSQPIKAKKQAPWRLLKSQIELMQKLIKDLGMNKPGGFSTENVMKVLLLGLEHPHNDVRDAALSCIVDVYKIVKEPLKSYFPPDDANTRKNPLYTKLFDSLDRADGKMTESERKAAAKKNKEDAEKSKMEEVKALQAQLQEMRSLAKAQVQENENEASPSTREENNNTKNNNGTKPTKTDLDKNSKKKSLVASRISIRPISQRHKDSEEVLEEDMCIFCGERNEKFSNDGVLDIHYWKSCPLLQRCAGCSQVVEICSLSDHLLNECDVQQNYTQCNKCGLAILKTQAQQHKKSPTCKVPSNSSKLTCPLCFIHVQDTEEHWKTHLVEKCKVNLQRLKKGVKKPTANSEPATKATPARNRSQIPRGTHKTPKKK